jgi:hypothetical protein
VAAAAAVAPARYIRFAEAQPVLAELAGRLPADLNNLSPEQLATAWPGWLERHDQEIRARLERGDEDTIVNWMLFGTSFTAKPKAVLGAVEATTSEDRELVVRRAIELISARLDDLVTALANPGTDERRLFARALFQKKGLSFATAAGRDGVRQYLTGAVMRVAQEQEQLDQELGATSGRDSIAEFVERSRLFRTRGLSLDTSLVPNYALEQSLAEMKKRGLLSAGGLRRIAIVGPGLDFADKDVGFDFYPQQTLQPFAILDSLRRLELVPATAGAAGPEIVLLDISPRIIDHVTRARARAARGTGYTLNLPLTKATPWEADIRKYWQDFGNQIGAPAQTPTSKAVADQAELRAVRATAASVQRLSVTNLNIVTDRLDGAAFDLVIATNVFVYYDVLEQALALSNVDAMLKPGAYLLANFAAPELRSLTIRPIETRTTLYARAPDANENILDFIVWYKAHAN